MRRVSSVLLLQRLLAKAGLLLLRLAILLLSVLLLLLERRLASRSVAAAEIGVGAGEHVVGGSVGKERHQRSMSSPGGGEVACRCNASCLVAGMIDAKMEPIVDPTGCQPRFATSPPRPRDDPFVEDNDK